MKWKCKVCGYIHEGELPADFVCPRCKQPASVFELIEEPKKNPYAGTKTERTSGKLLLVNPRQEISIHTLLL